MPEITKALIEWRDSRQAIFDCHLDSLDPAWRPLWDRLAQAESTLMSLARGL